MQRSERHRVIIRAVDSGARTIADLVTLTGQSPVTIRRDLTELAEQGALTRIRGGAAPVVQRGTQYPFGLRQTSDAPAKQALAAAAAARVRPGDSVLIDNGTTALAVADQLAGLGITAMALSLHAAAALARVPGNQVIVPGGTVGPDDLSFTGAGVAEAVEAMRFDVAFIGACAADPASGLTVADWNDARVKRAALSAARSSVLVATADKFSRTAAHRFGRLADLDVVLTTPHASPVVLEDLRAEGVEVQLVEQED